MSSPQKKFPTRPRAESFHPASADVWGPNRVADNSGVIKTEGILLFNTRIKTPRGLFVSERMNHQAADSQSDVVISIWNYLGGDRLTGDMWLMHLGIRYDIKGRITQTQESWESHCTSYQCRMCTDSVPL